jgi:hypothetical protein
MAGYSEPDGRRIAVEADAVISEGTMQAERPRARRYAFSASVELIDVASERKVREQTCDLSLFGCQIKCHEPWAVGTKVRLKIPYKGSVFTAWGRITRVQGAAVGVEFTKVEHKDEVVLEKWMAELRDSANATLLRSS